MANELPWEERPFKFEAKWLHVENFESVISLAWRDAGKDSFGLWSEKISHCGRILDR